jgi:general secretion pathway protein I
LSRSINTHPAGPRPFIPAASARLRASSTRYAGIQSRLRRIRQLGRRFRGEERTAACLEFRARASSMGFTLIEVVVALAVLAVSLTAIGSLVASNIRATRALDQRLALAATARAILTGLPNREQLSLSSSTGEIAGHRWRLDLLPFSATFVDPRRATPWVPQAVVLRVQSPTGQVLRLDTVRLRRGEGSKK